MELIQQAVHEARQGASIALATVVHASGSTPRHAGAHMLVWADGRTGGTVGGGRVEQEVVAAAREVAITGQARLVRHHLVRDLAMCCGGSMTLFLQPVASSVAALEEALALWAARRPFELISWLDGRPMQVRAAPVPPPRVGRLTRLSDDHIAQLVCPAERLVLFGAGHVARAIGPLARTVGFEVAVCDDNDTGGLDAPTPWARWRIESFDPRDVEHTIGPLGAGDFLLIVTRDHAVDQEILERALLCDQLSYLGLIGSRGKIERFRRRLEAKGLATPERWARLHAPIGLPIGSETPEEIAVSVVAELIALRRGVAPVRRDAPPPGPSSGESPR